MTSPNGLKQQIVQALDKLPDEKLGEVLDFVDFLVARQAQVTEPRELSQLVREKREEILRIAASHGAHNVRIFGSVARGEAGPESDVDVLVDMEAGRSLFDLGGLLSDLQELLNQPVDVVTEKGLREHIRERVLREAVPL